MPRKKPNQPQPSNGNGYNRIAAEATQAEKDAEREAARRAIDPDSEEWDEDGLTYRQRIFVEALFGPAGGSPKRAFDLAGYKAENANTKRAAISRLLTYVNVQKAIGRRAVANWGTKEDLLNMIRQGCVVNPDSLLTKKGTLNLKKARATGAMPWIESYDPSTGKFKLTSKRGMLDLYSKCLGLQRPEAQVTVASTDKEGRPVLKVYHGVTPDDL